MPDLTCGIDAGSRAVKVVLWDAAGRKVVGRGLGDQGIRQEALAEELLESTLAASGFARRDVRSVVATGYARGAVRSAGTTITEITCHARGVAHQVPGVRTVVEMGGQDCKVLRLDEGGAVQDFSMNDRCAAGTGRFLEVVAARLDSDLASLGRMAGAASKGAPISSMCVVFAETEIIGLLAGGTPPEEIVAGVQESVARRVASMAGRNLRPPVVFTGGVALVPGMAAALARALEVEVAVAPDPQMTGALGAALLAAARA